MFDEAIEFLQYYKNETVIIHLKDDNINIGNDTEYPDYMYGTVTTIKGGFGTYD